jgi:hypothetical protein
MPLFADLSPYLFSYDRSTRQHFLSLDGSRVHRLDGPAIVHHDGVELWSQNGLIHRDGGPAWFDDTGAERWLQHGQLHYDDGPAQVGPTGYCTYWLRGVRVTAANHTKLMLLDSETRRWAVEQIANADWKPSEIGPFVDAIAAALLDTSALLEASA